MIKIYVNKSQNSIFRSSNMFKWFISIHFKFCLFVDMCTRVQAPTQGRSIRASGPEIAGNCEPLDVGAGNWTHVLWKEQHKLLSTELSPSPPNFKGTKQNRQKYILKVV